MIIGNNQIPYRRFLKLFVRWDGTCKLLRLGRLVWSRGKGPGVVGGGYTAKLSLALRPSLFYWRRNWDGWQLTLAGLRLHYLRSFGGWIT